MKLSQYFVPTLREAPQDADAVSAKLMLRAGLIRKLGSGTYEWLPLGFRVLKKVEQIVREEMNRVGGQEVWLPVIQPKELWCETGRWGVYGKELLRITDRKDAEYCFAPTAEEVITNMVRRDVRSYRQLPLLLYQFGLKFRDEIRPRFGVMRAREFYMKDAYSFHATEADANLWYKKLYGAYDNICRRCGFKYAAVEAEAGPIGGNFSHEFMVLAETGENEIASCVCGYSANVEKAEVAKDEFLPADASKFEPLKEIPTPGIYTVDDVAKSLNLPASRFIKTLFYTADGEPVLALMRGDHQLNENKLRRALGCANLEKASEEVYTAIAGCNVGFAGPVGLREKFQSKPGVKPLKTVVADHAVAGIINGVTGANKTDAHLINVNIGRDYTPDAFADLRVAAKGDNCPVCKKPLEFSRGIEVGHTFKLGTKYSAAMKAEFLDEEQKAQTMIMGCYGIGVSRIVAAVIEQNNDANGILWPAPLAPFEFSLISIEGEDSTVHDAATKIYRQIQAAGMEALWDDRNERPGVKFKDADLMGMPYRVVVSAKTLADGECEFKLRSDKGRGERWKLAEIPEKLAALKNNWQKQPQIWSE